ncbi:MAG TPA: LLM class flavin-dependent oxidoreductase [Acidimicrobiia bacterium]|nr:LLM class flavin-dependent oxidoreductase [Acidimicrobiia bacterium]
MQLAIQTMRGYADSVELAQWAEASRVAAFAVADHYLAGKQSPYALDQLTVLAAVAAATETIELATLVSPITFRHPAVMLKTAVTLDEISGGRFTLGVGTGWMKDEHERFGFSFPPIGRRFDELEEALAYLRAGLDGDEAGFEGLRYRLAPGPAPQPQGSRVRLIVGGTGPRRTPDLAGRYADELNLTPSAAPIPDRIERARLAAAAAGRDPDALLISTAFPVIVGADPEEVTERIAMVAKRRRTSPEDIRTRWEEIGIPIGTTDQYLSRLEELHTDGVRRVYFQVAFDPIDDVRRAFDLLAPTTP